mmetsp:Transcript_14552/g.42538  ORF Transcript_14552/g.42538 Transcript_14552/m.42538 type:complete len:270 (-) Transcript_14552:423-1232(-)
MADRDGGHEPGGRVDEGTSQASSVDPLDQLLADYNFTCHPEARIKIKQQIAGCSLGFCLAKPWHTRSRLRITVKPDPGDRPPGLLAKNVQKLLLVPGHSQVAVFSRKVHMRWLRLQCVAGYNWARQKPTLDYRVTTKWSDGPRMKRKERFDFFDQGLNLRCKWNLEFNLPDMQGHLGEDNLGMDAVDVDWGRMDFDISQLDCVVRSRYPLWRGGRDTHTQARKALVMQTSAAAEPEEPWQPVPWLPWLSLPADWKSHWERVTPDDWERR